MGDALARLTLKSLSSNRDWDSEASTELAERNFLVEAEAQADHKAGDAADDSGAGEHKADLISTGSRLAVVGVLRIPIEVANHVIDSSLGAELEDRSERYSTPGAVRVDMRIRLVGR